MDTPTSEQAEVKTWHCRRCGCILGHVAGDGEQVLFTSLALPSLIRDCQGYVYTECARCGEVRRWFKRKAEHG